MNTFFESKVKFEKIDEQSGKTKKVTEKYIFEAVSYTDAETKIYEEMEKYINGEFNITSITKPNYSEVLSTFTGSIWYKGKIKFESFDTETSKSKKVSNNILVMADNVDDAYNNINEAYADMTVDFTIEGITDSKVIEFFKMD